ncbi:MAG: hypothetical protein ACI8PP_000414 [Candidatus Pseudothioglobus sp.]
MVKIINGVNNDLQRRTLLAEFLSILLIIPDLRIAQFKFDLCQALLARIIVKDTP